MAFCVWLRSLSVMFPRAIRVVASVRASVPFKAASVHGWAAFRVSGHPLMDTWAASLVIVNPAAVNMKYKCLCGREPPLGGFLEWNCWGRW